MSRVDYAHGLVIGKFYPPHCGHEYLIRTAARHCRSVTVGVLGSSVESISIAQRVAWLRDMFAGDRHVRIVGELDDVPVDYNSPAIWAAHVAIMRQAVHAADREYGKAPAVDVVFTSEHYGAELARQFGGAHVCLDNARTLYPVSGTAARASPAAHWDLLPPAVRAGLALRVVVLGAESTGTTTLARDLAGALRQRGGPWGHTAWVSEYGREHSLNLLALARAHKPAATAEDIAWQSGDFTVIAAEQCRLEEQAARHGGPVLVCDTDALATCVWHERYMGRSSAEVARLAGAMSARSLYLLTSDAGVPFEDDGLRDGEHLRGWMTARFRAVLGEQGVPWLEIDGPPDARLRSALAAVDAALGKAWQFAAPIEQRAP
jgi:HTH-type transcriptional repressor of NAD biosynthesis genes